MMRRLSNLPTKLRRAVHRIQSLGRPMQLAVFCICFAWIGLSTLEAADPPASPAEAAAVIDLSTFPLVQVVDPEEDVLQQRISGQSYLAKGSVADVASKLKSQFTKAGWVALEGGALTEQYATETLQKSDFVISMSVSMSGEPNQARVFIINHGNLDLTKLDLPEGLESQYDSPIMAMLASPWSVDETNERVSRSVLAAGWKPYGSTMNLRQFKKNGIRLNVNVMAAPAQNNRTILQISAEQMSADVPVPAGAEGVQYSDSTRQVLFDHDAPVKEVFAMVGRLLDAKGWTGTVDRPVTIGFRKHLIFRNVAKDMMEVTGYQVEGKTRVTIQFKTKADVDMIDKQIKDNAARREAEMAKSAIESMIEIPKPQGARIKGTTETSVAFELDSGKALAAVNKWVAALEKKGWKKTTNIRERVAGDLTLKRDSLELHVTYVDPGFIPATIDVSAFGKGTIKVK